MTTPPEPQPVGWRLPVPGWLRYVIWAAIIAATVGGTHSVPLKIASGILMVLAVAGLQLIDHLDGSAGRGWLVVAVCAAGVAATLLVPNGVGEVPAFIAVTRFPYGFDSRAGQAFTIVATVAVGGAVAWISSSYAGALAGLGVPMLVQRASDQRALVAERDRAQALLAELQAGREAETQAAALRERGRIARDMHDVLAHSLAGLSLQLQAARAVAAGHGDVLGPLDRAAELARDGLAEARAAVSALRDPVGLGLADVPTLVSRYPGAATLAVTGDAGTVAPEAGHAVYRAVQEALTNAARYAPGARVEVTLAWTAAALRVTVADTGRPRDREPVPSLGTGLGLAGMDERIRAAGGTLQAGPRPGGGWQVVVQVPVEDEP
jgi:signal transduction histidine kinase